MSLTTREIIAKNVANMLNDGDVVNLGIGIPTLASNFIPKYKTIFIHGENGYIGQDEELVMPDVYASEEEYRKWLEDHSAHKGNEKIGHKDLINAGCFFINLIPGASCFDSSMAFTIARGGHLDATVLGGFQVDRNGDFANWKIEGGRVTGMGGAMDMVAGSKKVIVAMEHNTKDGKPKIVEKVNMPLTGVHCVDYIVTELCVIHLMDKKFVVEKMMPGITKEKLQERTEAKLDFADNILEMIGD